jgi:hypothetical protein
VDGVRREEVAGHRTPPRTSRDRAREFGEQILGLGEVASALESWVQREKGVAAHRGCRGWRRGTRVRSGVTYIAAGELYLQGIRVCK